MKLPTLFFPGPTYFVRSSSNLTVAAEWKMTETDLISVSSSWKKHWRDFTAPIFTHLSKLSKTRAEFSKKNQHWKLRSIVIYRSGLLVVWRQICNGKLGWMVRTLSLLRSALYSGGHGFRSQLLLYTINLVLLITVKQLSRSYLYL